MSSYLSREQIKELGYETIMNGASCNGCVLHDGGSVTCDYHKQICKPRWGPLIDGKQTLAGGYQVYDVNGLGKGPLMAALEIAIGHG